MPNMVSSHLQVQYDINEIRSCTIINEERSGGGCVFRIVRVTSKEGIKNMDFEAPLHVASILDII